MKHIISVLIVALVAAMNLLGSASAVSSTHSVTPTVVSATGYNSASGGYYWCTGTFKNYNPVTGHWGVLVWNPKGTKEGEWTATDDDMDFSINGHCKGLGWQSGVYLVKTGTTVKSVAKNPCISSKHPTEYKHWYKHWYKHNHHWHYVWRYYWTAK
jgi:N-acetylmuramoyl-L-alanine amidase